jgi:quercetin dioxygenase-like cupin family protein
MQWTSLTQRTCTLLIFSLVPMPSLVTPQYITTPKTAPLILEENEGERRVVRGWPGHPDPGETFILKIDPQNGGSSRLVFMTVNLAPKGEIVAHKHPGADEILFLQTGTARVQLGDSVREVHAGATVFIPASSWISVSNIGREEIKAFAIFSAPGFEDYMRDVSAREGQKNVPLSETEDAAVAKKHSHAVVYKEP